MANIKFVSIPSKRLAASINASATTIQLNNIKDWAGSDLTSSDFGSILYAVLRNDANTLMEIVELDPTTIASTSITINKRGLKFDGDLTTEVSANKLSWVKNETIVELGTNVPQLLNHIVRIIGDQTIAGVKTFSELPATTAGDGIADNDLVRKAQLDAATLGQIGTDKLIVAGTAGETIADGNLVYFDTITNNEWMLCDADTAASVDNVLLGIAQGAGTNGNAITGGVLLLGVDDAQSGMTAGDIMYASNTAGSISSSAGTTEVTVGIAKSATELYFNPRVNQQITEDIQDALAGTSGTPSASNKFVTNDDTAEAKTANKIVRRDSNSDILVATTPTDGDAAASKTYVDTTPGAVYKNGTTTYDLSTASGTQNIAHGLGETPKKVKITVFIGTTTGNNDLSIGTYNGTSNNCVFYINNGTWYNTGADVSNSYGIVLTIDNANDYSAKGIITFDNTNIIITWTKTGSPTGSAKILWEANY